jgi:hypothetical protein
VLRIRDVLSRIPDPDPTIAPSWIRIRGVKKHRIPDPTYFCIKAINKFCLLIQDPDPTIAPSRIPDPGGKKAPDPESRIRIGNTAYIKKKSRKIAKQLSDIFITTIFVFLL